MIGNEGNDGGQAALELLERVEEISPNETGSGESDGRWQGAHC